MPDVKEFQATRPLAGDAKNLIDDLRALNTGIGTKLEYGVQNGYLEAEKIVGLAERLNVTPPRIKTRHWVYYEVVEIRSMAFDAYDDEDALGQARRMLQEYARLDEAPFSSRRSYYADQENITRNRVLSEPTTERPSTTTRPGRLYDHNGRLIRTATVPATSEPTITL